MVRGISRGSFGGSFVEDKNHPSDSYYDICEKSDGFDVCPTLSGLTGGIEEWDISKERELEITTKLAKFAVDDYNKTHNGDLEFVSLARANGQGCAGFFYYLTFWARPRSHKLPKPYQAKIFKKMFNQGLEVRIFRRRPKSNPYRIPGPRPSFQKIKEKKPKPPSVPKGAFLRFMNNLRKLPELEHCVLDHINTQIPIRPRFLKCLIRVWKSAFFDDALKVIRTNYLDIVEFMPALGE